MVNYWKILFWLEKDRDFGVLSASERIGRQIDLHPVAYVILFILRFLSFDTLLPLAMEMEDLLKVDSVLELGTS